MTDAVLHLIKLGQAMNKTDNIIVLQQHLDERRAMEEFASIIAESYENERDSIFDLSNEHQEKNHDYQQRRTAPIREH